MATAAPQASGVLWLDGELQGEGAELLRESGRRGEAGGGGYGERRRWVRSDTGERERGRGEEESGESERVREAVWRRPAFQGDEEAPGKQGGRWRGAVARARAGHAPLPLSRTKTTEEEAGWAACWLGRPAAAGPEAPGRSPGKVFLFYFFF